MLKFIMLILIYSTAILFLVRGLWGSITASHPEPTYSARRKLKISGILFAIAVLMTIVYTSFIWVFLFKLIAIFLILCLIYICVEKIISKVIH